MLTGSTTSIVVCAVWRPPSPTAVATTVRPLPGPVKETDTVPPLRGVAVPPVTSQVTRSGVAPVTWAEQSVDSPTRMTRGAQEMLSVTGPAVTGARTVIDNVRCAVPPGDKARTVSVFTPVVAYVVVNSKPWPLVVTAPGADHSMVRTLTEARHAAECQLGPTWARKRPSRIEESLPTQVHPDVELSWFPQGATVPFDVSISGTSALGVSVGVGVAVGVDDPVV